MRHNRSQQGHPAVAADFTHLPEFSAVVVFAGNGLQYDMT